jgi:hypothetical protein
MSRRAHFPRGITTWSSIAAEFDLSVRADWGHGLDHRHHVARAGCYQVASTRRGHIAEPINRDAYRTRRSTLETTLRKTLELDPSGALFCRYG